MKKSKLPKKPKPAKAPKDAEPKLCPHGYPLDAVCIKCREY